jgi:hypothetical protein
MKTCESCGQSITEDARFCDRCGALQTNRRGLTYGPFFYPAPLDLAQSVYQLLLAIGNTLDTKEKEEILMAIITYLLWNSPEAARKLSEWYNRKKRPEYVS